MIARSSSGSSGKRRIRVLDRAPMSAWTAGIVEQA